MRTCADQLHGLSTALVAGALLVALAVGPAPLARAQGPDPSGGVQLSNETTFTRWAFAAESLPIRESPDAGARQIDTVSLTTPEGRTDVYTLLRSWTDPVGMEWVQVRVMMRPEQQIAWVAAAAFGPAQLIHTQLIVHRGHLRATLRRNGYRVWTSRIGIGKAGTETPAGHFWIRERLRSTSPGGPYGPWAFGTSAFSRLSDWPGGGVIGIHGTNEPRLIPGRPSHGCIRVPNPQIRKLARLMPIGTPVWIH